ncbi:aminoglycoside phosphotransferase family protein [Roseovarius sp. M141]|uniref:aminoglycoside phosphotransferase family protein n=1 Tax=Roseovarius sp. M141 TaxID=2583806 RepID=UPI0020CFB57D|nr:aminoglycoside phosphotransferase family protein [Roseovarius sp. M141]MCQ0093011.1 aminoglycoside phosphotransferase family protein [Roseovarius sp. M141]
MIAKLPPLPDLDAMMQITARLEYARTHTPCLKGAEAGDLIRHVPGKRAVFRGTLDGRDVIFRLNLTSENGATQREWDELQRIWPYMATGDLRTPEPICASLDAGIIVQERITGTPLLELLYALEPQARAKWLAPAAAWLRQSTAMSQGWRAAAPDRWIARAEAASAQQPFAQLRALEVAILSQMRRLAPDVAAVPWRTAICHGDYHPNNLIAQGMRLTGIDLGGSQRLPLLKDAARFAMHMGRRRLRLSGITCLGVDRTCLTTFADTLDMSAQERGAVLPFFLAFEALIRVENTGLPAGRIRRAEKMYRALLQDLERTGSAAPLL